jgi:phosphoserine aminotransferase
MISGVAAGCRLAPMEPSLITIPHELRPEDGRFGSGPSKVRDDAVAALSEAARGYLGTSHRRAPVRAMVRRLKEGLRALFELPDDYEVTLGIGGATAFWDACAFGLVDVQSQHLVFGEFSSKWASAVRSAPHLKEPEVIESIPGTHPTPQPSEGVDLYALTHNETSTGVAMPVRRVPGEALTVVDATSAAGGLRVDPEEFDVYYFSPQKGFASDGGLWMAVLSPRALERIGRVAASGRYIPPSLDLSIALDNSRKDQTYNTPGLATLFLVVEQLEWMLANGGLEWAAARCDSSAAILYGWAEASQAAAPFVADPRDRSSVVGTIDLVGVDQPAVSWALRANGIFDTEPYRKLGRNQLRIGMFPAIDPHDVAQLTRSVDFVIDALTA